MNNEKIIKEVLAARRGKGPWMIWFPATSPRYVSRPIQTKSELQALGSWLAADSPDKSGRERDWHNTIFKDYKRVTYNGIDYNKLQGKLLYSELVKTKNWDGVDLGSPIEEKKTKLPSPIKNKVEQMVLDL